MIITGAFQIIIVILNNKEHINLFHQNNQDYCPNRYNLYKNDNVYTQKIIIYLSY